MEHKHDAKKRIEQTHYRLLRHKKLKFYGTLVMHGDTVMDDSIPTACTNGLDIKYSPNFVQTLNNKELMFLVLHECMHKAYKHAIVWKNLIKKDSLLANLAMDYVINLELSDMLGEMPDKPFEVIENCLLDEAFRGMDTLQVFKHLEEENQQNEDSPGVGGETNDNSTDTSDTLDGYSNKIKKRAESIIDEHDWDFDSPEKLKEVEESLDRAIRQAIETAGEGCGDMISNIKELMKVTTPWQELLADFIHANASGDDISSYRRFNRRTQAAGIYLPTHINESAGTIVVGIDTSASITQTDVDKFLSELKVIVEDVTPEKVHLLYWDTRVAAHETYEEDEYDDLVETTKPRGGGGTNPTCCVEYIKDNISLDNEVECMLLLTDAYLGNLSKESWENLDYPVLWAVCPDGNKRFNPSVGQVINLT